MYDPRYRKIGKCTVDAMLHNATLVIGRYDKHEINLIPMSPEMYKLNTTKTQG